MNGILVSQTLRTLIEEGAIAALKPIRKRQIQPSSLDLRLGARVWQLQCSFLPGTAGIERKLGRLATASWRLDAEEPTVLHCGGVYLAEIEEVLELPEWIWGRGNPKSSTGRLDVFVRLLTERGYAFDTVPEGYQGRLYLEITPQSFHVAVRRGDCLGQLRLAAGRSTLSAEALRERQESRPLCLWSDDTPAPVSEHPLPGVLMSVDLESVHGGPVGYLARRHQPPVDLARRNLSVVGTGRRCCPPERKGTSWSPSSSTSSRPESGCGFRRTCARSWWPLMPRRASCAPTTRGSSTLGLAGTARTVRARGSCWRSAPTMSRSCWSTASRCFGWSSCATRRSQTCCMGLQGATTRCRS